MFRLIWIASIHTRDFPHRYMPTNIVLDAIRTRRGLKSGVPAMLLAIPYLAAGNIMTILIGRGAPGWFHLLVLLCIWNAFKFLVMGPVSVVLLVRTGTAERRNRRMLPRSPAPRPDGRENRGLRWRTLWAKSVREGAVMSGVADVGVDEHRARVVLALLAEPDDPVTGGLLRRVGAVGTLGLLDTNTGIPGLARVDAQVWRDRLTSPGRLEGPGEKLRMVEESGIATLIPGDAHWPRALDDLGERAPYVLFVRGTTSFLARPMNDLVTVTDSRTASVYGEHVVGELAGDLADRERVLVAGGAYGVEAAVHCAALAAGGDTIAVLAGGVDHPYPSRHRDLLDQVGDVGALVSELPPGSMPTRHRFLSRSRLLGTLSGSTVVVEAGARSEALRVAAEAHQLGRQVGAAPGPVTSITSHGPHELLRTGHARLVTSAADVEQLTADRAAARPGLSAEPTRETSRPLTRKPPTNGRRF